jgi:GT2 family glycosyltransferase
VGTTVFNAAGNIEWGGEIHSKVGVNENIPTMGFTVSRSLLNIIGYLDENLEIFFEDLDFIKRALDSNLKTKFNHTVCFTHVGSVTISRKRAPAHYYRVRNIFWYFKKHPESCSSLEKIKHVRINFPQHVKAVLSGIKHGEFKQSSAITFAIIRAIYDGLFKSPDKNVTYCDRL